MSDRYNASDERVYVGNKMYRRTVWTVSREVGTGRMYGFITFAGQKLKVWLIGEGEHSHWNANK